MAALPPAGQSEQSAPGEPSPPLRLPPGARQVRLRGKWSTPLTLETRAEEGDWQALGRLEPQARFDLMARIERLTARLKTPAGWNARLFWLALGLYLAVRLAALSAYPIYFFSDEAIQSVLAADLVRDGLRGYSGELLPTYFPNGGQYNLSVSVYAQVLPTLIFGKAIWVTRGAAVLLSLLAALGLGLALRAAFSPRAGWLAILALSATPAWFLHSRTAFETALAVDFYAVFLCAYLLYRRGQPRWIYVAAVSAALCFYSYSPAQLVIAASGLLLFLSDLGYHWRRRKLLLRVLGLGVLLAAPYLRDLAIHPGSVGQHLARLGSYWVQDSPLSAKLAQAAILYLRALDPRYWFLPNKIDIARHTMGGWGHLLNWSAPFALLGLLRALRGLRQSENRALLLCLLACPLGAVPVALGVTRMLCLVIPAAALTALGFERAIALCGRLRPGAAKLSAAAAGGLLALASPALLLSALVQGPRWSENYGLGGMQYGARQVFAAIRAELALHPERPLVLSPTWTNGADTLARFFLPDPLPISVRSVRTHIETYTPFAPETLFILTPDEFAALPGDLFPEVVIEKTLPYPNGRPGFYFARLAYAADAREVLARREAELAAPVEELVTIGGSPVAVLHTRLDIGEIGLAFDGDAETLLRTAVSNPMRVELTFPRPVELSGLALRVGGVPTAIHVTVEMENGAPPREFETTLAEVPDPRTAQIDFGARLAVRALRVEIRNLNDPAEAHVHLWEITFH